MSIFSKTPKHRQNRSNFNLSYANQFTCKSGYLYPIYAEETTPGDIFHVGTGFVLRSQPLVGPLFTPYYVDIRYFYVPNRIIWKSWKEFLMDALENVANPTSPTTLGKFAHPFVSGDPSVDEQIGTGSIYDFFNVPAGYRGNFNALPFRAYNMIWNEYYRDQNLQNGAPMNLDDGADPVDYYRLRLSNYRKDYFTSALPWTQRGAEVDLPALVKLRDPYDLYPLSDHYQKVVVPGQNSWDDAGFGSSFELASTSQGMLRSATAATFGTNQDTAVNQAHAGGSLGYIFNESNNRSFINPVWFDPNGTFSTNINIRDLRFATAVQRFLEKEAQVGGGRYADFIRGIYGVNIGDATLQRPLYLGGGSQAINVSPVEQTSSTDDVSPQGTLAGKGYLSSLMKMNKPTLISEHGWIIGLMCIRPRSLYYRGINRHLLKETRFDYLIPGFQHLGEQEIQKQEVVAKTYDMTTPVATVQEILSENKSTFGYTSRQAEYKSHNGEIHGEMETSMHHYVVARDLPSFGDPRNPAIALNGSFIEARPNEEEVFAVSPDVADSWIVDSFNVANVLRDLVKHPKYGL